jgi:hypothetical protein
LRRVPFFALSQLFPIHLARRHDGQTQVLEAVHALGALVLYIVAQQIEGYDLALGNSIRKDGVNVSLPGQPIHRFGHIAGGIDVGVVGALAIKAKLHHRMDQHVKKRTQPAFASTTVPSGAAICSPSNCSDTTCDTLSSPIETP